MDVKQSGRAIADALREPRVFVIALAASVSLLTSLLIGVAWAWQVENARAERIDDFGRATVGQLASLAVAPLIALDRIRLGALVTRLAEMPTIRLAEVVTLDERVVATAGSEAMEGAHVFVEPIAFEGEVAGYARLLVEDAAIGKSLPGYAVWLMIVLAAAGAAFAAHFLYAFAFESLVDTSGEQPEDTPNPALQFLIVVNFFNQNRIPAAERGPIMTAARLRLDRLAANTRTLLLDLPGTGWALCVKPRIANPDFGFDAFLTALACAEVLDELNADTTRPSRFELVFRFGLHIAPPFASIDALRQSDALQDALVLSAVVPDGSIAASAEAFEKLLRPERLVAEELSHAVLDSLATQRRDGCVVVSTIAEAYRPALDRALEQIRKN